MKKNKQHELKIGSKKRNIYQLSAIIVVLCCFSACKKLVGINPPDTLTTTANVFNSNSTAVAAQLGVYSQLSADMNGQFSLNAMTALCADELNSTSISSPFKDAYINALNVTDATSNLMPGFSSYYKYIYYENAILENTKNAANLSAAVKQLSAGEAQFMRAFCYLYLVNLYGDVPLATTTDYKVNGLLARTPKDQVYQQIVTDLINAESLLSKKYVDATDTAATVDRVRPTTWAAAALLARVYLFMGNGHYADAEKQASIVIANTALFSLASDLNAVFKANSNEAIWQLLPVNNSSGATSEGSNFILTTSPGTNTTAFGTISPGLMNAFETGDKRQTNWISNITVSGTTYYFPYKYKNRTTAGEYSMVLRLAEQYLIRAEARAQQNNIAGATGALADLNVIRHRAGLGDYSGAADQTSVLAAIAHERQVELFTEGHRWLDLKRTGTVDAVMGTGGACAVKGGNWSSYKAFWPVSLRDVTNDPNLSQTPGY